MGRGSIQTGAPALQARSGTPWIRRIQHLTRLIGRQKSIHLGLYRLDAHPLDVCRRGRGRKLRLALVDPLHVAVERLEQTRDGTTDVAGAVELQVKQWLCRRPVLERGGVEQPVEAGPHDQAAQQLAAERRNPFFQAPSWLSR